MTDDDSPPTARVASQHEPHQANPGFPHLGRDELDHGHAVFAIAAHLRSLGLEHWTPRLVRWLSFYDGFERWVDPGHEPGMCVRDLLACYVLRLHSPGVQPANPVSSEPAALQQAIIDDLLKFDFLRYSAHWGGNLFPDAHSLVWVPLRQTWLSFLESARTGDELVVMPDEPNPIPPAYVHRAFLLLA